MTRKRDDAADDNTEPASPAAGPSEARQAFLAGQLTWRQYVEAESESEQS